MDIKWQDIIGLFVLAIPIACVARTIIFEDVFREAREFCASKSKSCRNCMQRKFFYLFTCEYCFSHYVALFFMFLCGFKLLYADWRGYLVAFFSLVFIANVYMNLYNRLRVDITSEKKHIQEKEKQIEKLDKEIESVRSDGQ